MTQDPETSWYAAKVRLVVVLEKSGAAHYGDSVFLYRSTSYEVAFQRALELGRAQEESYRNGDGERVAWRLKEILTLDEIGAVVRDDAEVHYFSVPLGPDEDLAFDSQLHPEASQPSNTGVASPE